MAWFVLPFLATKLLTAGLYAAHRARWQPYDPEWLVRLVRAQCPHEAAVDAALQQCTRAHVVSARRTRFVSGFHPKRANSPWEFERHLRLDCPEHGALLLDILRNGQVGGVEYLDRYEPGPP